MGTFDKQCSTERFPQGKQETIYINQLKEMRKKNPTNYFVYRRNPKPAHSVLSTPSHCSLQQLTHFPVKLLLYNQHVYITRACHPRANHKVRFPFDPIFQKLWGSKSKIITYLVQITRLFISPSRLVLKISPSRLLSWSMSTCLDNLPRQVD